MNFLELKYKDKTYTNQIDILFILKSENFYWLVDSEVSNAIIEIKKKTIIWHSGSFLVGNWYYGIFKGGDFFGTWENGIFESGNFKGRWLSGVDLTKNN
jgi:hypothetical protein